ncbi:hypothetical protein M514_22890 [Trichuris suis]|uniref:Uncharacterized protein n=1 Tax=Trichuris suis TaxID=68888 RepID=A0A085N651_9BILA|nr:hypothetical protein M514_22890 [Trichuris suis]
MSEGEVRSFCCEFCQQRMAILQSTVPCLLSSNSQALAGCLRQLPFIAVLHTLDEWKLKRHSRNKVGI